MRFFQRLILSCASLRDSTKGGLDIFHYIGPGLLITVGFIDPGNWAANLAAGADYGYALLWMVTLSTFMLIVLQHNAAHLGIVTGDCLAESITRHIPRRVARPILWTAFAASCMTSMAEVLGGAIALQMLFNIPVAYGSLLIVILVLLMLVSNSYIKVERWIIGFVSLIGLSFLYELSLVNTDWQAAASAWVTPSFPDGSLWVIMSVLGAVVMPHNIFLHSEVIQSRKWNLQDDNIIKKQLKYEFLDTLFAMLIGWAINSAMIILAAATFWVAGETVSELTQAQNLLQPLLGNNAAAIFAVALLLAGLASSITSGMAGGIIAAGMQGEAYHIKDKHSLIGVVGTLLLGLMLIWLTDDPFKGLLLSQMFLSVQLPITMMALLYLTSSPKVMGKYVNPPGTRYLLIVLTFIVSALNVALFISTFR